MFCCFVAKLHLLDKFIVNLMCSSFCYNEYCVQYSFCILAKILFVDLSHGSTHSGQGVFMTYANQFALTISSLDSSDRALLTMNCSVMKVSMCVSRCPFDYPNLAQDAYTRLRKAQILEIIFVNKIKFEKVSKQIYKLM